MIYWYYDVADDNDEEVECFGVLDEILDDFYYLSEEDGSFWV